MVRKEREQDSRDSLIDLKELKHFQKEGVIRRSNATEKSIITKASNSLLDWHPRGHCCY